jgi:hypothetical protein
MALTVEWICAAEDDAALFELLSGEIQRLLPVEVSEDRDIYHQTLTALPRGLRAMAGMHFFDVSMALDDLAWHFGNQNDERDLTETLNGLRELELPEFADFFEKMWNFFKPHMRQLQTGERDGKEFHVWLRDIGAQELADPMNKKIWEYCKRHDLGLLTSWPVYARKYPERCVVAEVKS